MMMTDAYSNIRKGWVTCTGLGWMDEGINKCNDYISLIFVGVALWFDKAAFIVQVE